jgi:diketogulonate reductase-like aldo/keto reductase
MGREAHGLRTFCDSRGIRTFAYGAIGEPGPNEMLLNDPTLAEIALSHNRSPEEVAVRWVLQTGAALSVRPTKEFGLGVSACRADETCARGIMARANSFNWQLTKREMAKLDALNNPDDNPTLFSSAGCPGAFVMPTIK